MLKLIRYEFRKSRAHLLVFLGICCAAELYFVISLLADQLSHTVAAISLLMILAFAAIVFILIRGIQSYASELNSRSSYLLFMTPNSALKILGSKYLYTFLNGLLLGGLTGVVAFLDLVAVNDRYGEYGAFLRGIQSLLTLQGIHVDQILYAVLFFVVYALLSLLSTVALAYLAITLAHTLFRDKKWRWLPAVLFFATLTAGVTWLSQRFPSALDALVFVEPQSGGQPVQEAVNTLTGVVIPSLIPRALVSFGTMLASLFISAPLLEKRISL